MRSDARTWLYQQPLDIYRSITFDVSEVVPEHTVGNRRVDYALRPGSPNAVFIEVKRRGENLDRHQQQLLEYCFQEGVKLAALTNGLTWWLYLPLQAVLMFSDSALPNWPAKMMLL